MEPLVRIRRRTRRPLARRLSPVKTTQFKRKSKKSKFSCFCSENEKPEKFPIIWSELRQNMQLCDGVVKCDDNTEYKIHRAILSAVSPFFKALFLNTLQGGQPEATEVQIKVPGDVFNLILDYAYTGRCDITGDTVQALLTYADQLEVVGIVKLCCYFIIENLDPSNCIGALFLGKHFFCYNLEERGRKYVMNHFEDVIQQSPDLCRLDPDDLEELLSDDELNVRDEVKVFETVQKWVEYSISTREIYLPNLLKCIRIGLMPDEYINEIFLKWNLIQNNQTCKDIVDSARSFLSAWSDEPFTFVDSIKRPRVPYEVVFAVGGWSAGSPTSFIETYDIRADRWLLCMHLDVAARAYHGMCTMDGLIYIIGGFDGSEHFNSMRSFNPITREWREHACMYYPRCYVSVTIYLGKIYAMGGYNGRTRMCSAERYCPVTNQWEQIAPMVRNRSDASAAVAKNKIFVAGGFNGNEVLRSVEMYDPEENQWSFVASMNEARSGVSLVSYNDKLYIFGGFNGFARLRSVERYSIENRKWTLISEMDHPRSNFATVILNNVIYVIGGFNGSTTIGNVEYYVVEKNEWFSVKPMNLNRSALSACVLVGLPNAREYSYVYKEGQTTEMLESINATDS